MRVDREGPRHEAILGFLRRSLPPAAAKTLWHTPNENAHKVQFRAKLRRLGLAAGVEDLSFVWNEKYFAFEIKDSSGKPSPAQEKRQAALWSVGARYAVVMSIEDVEEYLIKWGVPLSGRTQKRIPAQSG